jgi:hypothetical protein
MEVRWTETAFESLASIKAFISQDSPSYGLAVVGRLYQAVTNSLSSPTRAGWFRSMVAPRSANSCVLPTGLSTGVGQSSSKSSLYSDRRSPFRPSRSERALANPEMDADGRSKGRGPGRRLAPTRPRRKN